MHVHTKPCEMQPLPHAPQFIFRRVAAPQFIFRRVVMLVNHNEKKMYEQQVRQWGEETNIFLEET